MSAASVWALGGREDPLSQADRLIDAQKYDEAIVYLSEFIKANPDRFDEAQAKLRTIAKLRLSYNQTYFELIEALKDETRTETERLALIEKILKDYPPTNEVERAFIAQAYELNTFTTNKTKFDTIIRDGRALIDGGRFLEAAKLYETGFELYQLQFRTLDQVSAELKDDSLSYVEAVSASIDYLEAGKNSLQTAFAALASAYERFAAAGAADIAAAEAAYGSALERARAVALDQFTTRDAVLESGRALVANFERYKLESGTTTESSFLPFAYRLVLGRADEEQLEGVLGALDAEWAYALGQAQESVDKGMASLVASARQAYESGSWADADATFQRAAALADRAAPLLALWSYYLPSELQDASTPFGRLIVGEQGPKYLSLGHAADSARSWAALARLQDSMDAGDRGLAGYDPEGAARDIALAAFSQRRDAFIQHYAQAEALRAASGARAERLGAASAAGLGDDASIELQGALDGSISAAATRARSLETRAVARAAAYEYQLIADAADAALAFIEQGRSLLDGLPSDDPQIPDAIFKYPGRALQSLGGGDQALRAISGRISEYLNKYRSLPAYLASAVSVTEWIERVSAQSATNAARISETRDLTARAQEQKRQADSSRMEAERRVAEARSALKANNFEIARERLDRASERYLTSLSFEQDAALRAASDRLLSELASSIIKAQNELVIADTRRLLTEGKSQYLEGQFDRAESALLQARSRWNTTNATPEVEVEYWLKLVQTALSVKSGRDIPITAPLYPEMSQLISLAKGYYEEGAALLAKRDRVGALNQFLLARQKIADIKVIFPLNQEARVLELRIDQLTDADAFNRQFARMVEEARAKINTNSDLTTAYSDLKDLEAINPRYAGLRALIEQAEIKLGFRQPPPDPRAIARARELVAAAQRIFDSGDTSRFPLARTQLEEAILLDPNNESASRLKDRIATIIGGTQTIVLSAAAEALYNEAVSAFSRADYITARARLARLSASFTQASRVQKVLDLDARLSAVGY